MIQFYIELLAAYLFKNEEIENIFIQESWVFEQIYLSMTILL